MKVLRKIRESNDFVLNLEFKSFNELKNSIIATFCPDLTYDDRNFKMKVSKPEVKSNSSGVDFLFKPFSIEANTEIVIESKQVDLYISIRLTLVTSELVKGKVSSSKTFVAVIEREGKGTMKSGIYRD